MVDYSAWGKIDVSDDEDDTHPNIDTPSLFRLRHDARIDRMKELEEDKAQLMEMRTALASRKEEAQRNRTAGEPGDTQEESLQELESAVEELALQVANKEKFLPWNVDTLSTEKFSRTLINASSPVSSSKQGTEEDYKSFITKHKDLLDSFASLSTLLESQNFLETSPDLLCPYTSEYLLKRAIDAALEEEGDVDKLCTQCVTIHLLLLMGDAMKKPLRPLIPLYFTRIAHELQAFHEEVATLRHRVDTEAEDRAKELRLGPGGLDPLVVAAELPEDLRQCFLLRDEALLQSVISKMDPAEAERLMQRCVDAGLWIAPPDSSPPN